MAARRRVTNDNDPYEGSEARASLNRGPHSRPAVSETLRRVEGDWFRAERDGEVIVFLRGETLPSWAPTESL